MRFLALFFIRGQRADGPDGPCDGRCVENKRQIKKSIEHLKSDPSTLTSHVASWARAGGTMARGRGSRTWHVGRRMEMSAPHAPTRSCGHGMVGWDMEMDSQVDMRVMRAPAGRIHRPRDSRKRAVIPYLGDATTPPPTTPPAIQIRQTSFLGRRLGTGL